MSRSARFHNERAEHPAGRNLCWRGLLQFANVRTVAKPCRYRYLAFEFFLQCPQRDSVEFVYPSTDIRPVGGTLPGGRDHRQSRRTAERTRIVSQRVLIKAPIPSFRGDSINED